MPSQCLTFSVQLAKRAAKTGMHGAMQDRRNSTTGAFISSATDISHKRFWDGRAVPRR